MLFHTWYAKTPIGWIGIRAAAYRRRTRLLPQLQAARQREQAEMSDYLADVQRYDKKASADTVQKIVKHLGIALRSKDASLVACSDQAELDRVREKWCMKKLGETDAAKCDKVITKTCAAMKDDNSKQRVTFYYLVAKDLGKLQTL
jgi:hypothetical protein